MIEFVADLIERYKLQWRNQFALKAADEIEKLTLAWAEAFTALKLSKSIAKAAWPVAIKQQWPPSPAEFYKLGFEVLCRQKGYLSAEQAFDNVPAHKRDLVTWNTYARIGSWDFQHVSADKLKPRYVKIYGEVLAQAISDPGQLRQVPPRQKTIEQKQIPASPEFANAQIEKMQAMLKGAAA